MKKIADFVVRIRFVLLAVFVGLIIASIFLIPKVKINFDFNKYLDQESETIAALNKMEEEFGRNGTAQVMVADVDLETAQSLKAVIESIDGVSAVTFDEVNGFNNDNKKALFKLIISGEDSAAVIADVRAALDGYNVSMNGANVNTGFLVGAVSNDLLIIMIVACIIVLAILFLSSTSWIDPLVFMIVIAGAIAINLGTNFLMGEISFITQSICMVMQLALSMDYSIAMLHRFIEERERGLAPKNAAASALSKTFAPISSSSLTTVAGLIALVFMRFTLGFDIGMVLAKGVLISLLVTFLFMPGILILFSPLLEKTKHKSLHTLIKEKTAVRHTKKQQSYESAIKSSAPADNAVNAGQKTKKPKPPRTFADFQFKSRFAVPAVLAVLILVGFILQTNLSYSYKVETAKDPDSSINVENRQIEEAFGKQNNIIVMLPAGNREDDESLNVRDKQFIAYMLNYTFEGEHVITSAQGLVSTGLYEYVNAAYVAGILGLPVGVVGNLISLGGFDPQSVQLKALIDFFASAEGSAAVDTYVNSITYPVRHYAPMTSAEFAAFYGINESDFAGYYSANASDPLAAAPAFDIIKYIVDNGIQTASPAFPVIYFSGLADVSSDDIKTMLNLGQDDNETVGLLFAMMGKPGAETVKLHELGYFVRSGAFSSLFTGSLAQIDELNKTVQTAVGMFDSGSYTRFIFNLAFEIDSREAYAVIGELKADFSERFDEYYLISESSTYMDIQKLFTRDSVVINLISFFAIFLIILLTFRSLSIPVLLTLLIQGAIWIAMSVSVVSATPIFFICYLVIMCIQMGATVDYAILMTDRYIEARKLTGRKEAVHFAFDKSMPTILTSGSILVIAAFIVGIVSRVPMISTLGLVLSLGCLISLLCVVFALPQLLILCDKIIRKTTWRLKFFDENQAAEKAGEEAHTHVDLAGQEIEDILSGDTE